MQIATCQSSPTEGAEVLVITRAAKSNNQPLKGLCYEVASDNAMFPVLRQGKPFVVDCDDRDLCPMGGLVLLQSPGGQRTVRRVILQLDGSFGVIADHPQYPSESVSADTLRAAVVGRVVFVSPE